jgi:hypothetical protein
MSATRLGIVTNAKQRAATAAHVEAPAPELKTGAQQGLRGPNGTLTPPPSPATTSQGWLGRSFWRDGKRPLGQLEYSLLFRPTP